MNIHMLGDGVTAKAVTNKINKLKDYQLSSIEDADIIVTSPGIPPNQFPKTNKPIISEIEFACKIMKEMNILPFIIAVTGTNGKTTVTSLISHILNCPAVGNIGTTMISIIPDNTKKQNKTTPVIVVELSSYQLYTSTTFKPNISIITNITEDHISWHESMNNYIDAKKNIFKNQTEKDLLIYNKNDIETQKIISFAKCKTYGFSDQDKTPKIKSNPQMPGAHNLENSICSFIACKEYGINDKEIINKISTFSGVEHRIELVTNYNGIPIYNDSKATNPEATITALNALGKEGIIILGGKDKNTSLENMANLLKKNESQIILIGEATARFEKKLKEKDLTDIYIVKSMKDACKKALSLSSLSKYILLSPACASFDMYNSYEERGQNFKATITELINEKK